MVKWEELWDEVGGEIFLKSGSKVFCRNVGHLLEVGFPTNTFEYPLPENSTPLTKGLMSW